MAALTGPSEPSAAVAVQTHAAYNQERCQGQPGLETCFLGSESNVVYGCLSHNHLLLVLLCWLTRAKWDLEEEDRKVLSILGVLDPDGRLDLEAAVAVLNLAELHTSIQEGLSMEVLSSDIEVEEPGACCLICTAINSNSALALRTTELTAIAVLSGECALQ